MDSIYLRVTCTSGFVNYCLCLDLVVLLLSTSYTINVTFNSERSITLANFDFEEGRKLWKACYYELLSDL